MLHPLYGLDVTSVTSPLGGRPTPSIHRGHRALGAQLTGGACPFPNLPPGEPRPRAARRPRRARSCSCPAGASSWPLATPRHASTSVSATACWSRSPSSALHAAQAGLRHPQAPRHRAPHRQHHRPHRAAAGEHRASSATVSTPLVRTFAAMIEPPTHSHGWCLAGARLPPTTSGGGHGASTAFPAMGRRTWKDSASMSFRGLW